MLKSYFYFLNFGEYYHTFFKEYKKSENVKQTSTTCETSTVITPNQSLSQLLNVFNNWTLLINGFIINDEYINLKNEAS